MQTVVSSTRCDHNAVITEAKKQIEANYGKATAAMSNASIVRYMWFAQPGADDHRYRTVNYVACFIL